MYFRVFIKFRVCTCIHDTRYRRVSCIHGHISVRDVAMSGGEQLRRAESERCPREARADHRPRASALERCLLVFVRCLLIACSLHSPHLWADSNIIECRFVFAGVHESRAARINTLGLCACTLQLFYTIQQGRSQVFIGGPAGAK